jgi:hypothetical protein
MPALFPFPHRRKRERERLAAIDATSASHPQGFVGVPVDTTTAGVHPLCPGNHLLLARQDEENTAPPLHLDSDIEAPTLQQLPPPRHRTSKIRSSSTTPSPTNPNFSLAFSLGPRRGVPRSKWRCRAPSSEAYHKWEPRSQWTTSSPNLSGLVLPFSWHLFWQRRGTCVSSPYAASRSTTFCRLAHPLLPRGHDRCWTGSGASASSWYC